MSGDDLLGFGRREFEHFAGHGFAEAIDAGDAVFDFQDRPDFFDVEVVRGQPLRFRGGGYP